MTLIKCSLCPQEFDDTEKLIKIQMEVHEKFHALRKHSIKGENGQVSERNVNTKVGKVEWKEIE